MVVGGAARATSAEERVGGAGATEPSDVARNVPRGRACACVKGMSQMTDTSSTTTVTGTTGPTTMTSPPARRGRASFYALCLAILIIGLLLLWHFGAFTRTPRIAMVTSGDTPYLQLVTDG